MVLEKVTKETGIFINAFYNDNFYVTIKTNNFKKNFKFNFAPYFYLVSNETLKKEDILKLKNNLKGILEIIKTEKNNFSNVYKIEFYDVESLISSRTHLLAKEILLSTSYSLKEYDIPFIHRFFIDYNLSCFKKIKFTYKDDQLLSFEIIDDVMPESLSHLTFDIEVLPLKDLSFPEPKSSPIISIAVMDKNYNKKIFFLKDINYDEKNFKKENIQKDTEVLFFSNESLMIESFFKFIENKNSDLIFTYNGDIFDFNYILKRYKILNSKEISFSRKITFHKRGNRSISIDSIIHIDTYILMRLLNYLQIFNYPKLDLNTVYENITGKNKIKFKISDFRDFYNSKNYEKIIEYNIDDVNATYYLSINYLSIINEISKLIKTPIFDVLRISAGQMIEKLFIYNFYKKNLIIENKPSQELVSKRYEFNFTGAFVKDPLVGIHENIAIVDFRSYHISILMAYNISFDTINLENAKNTKQVLDFKISQDKKGFVPDLLESFLNLRINIKKEMNKKDKNSQEYKTLYAKQYALKILLASTYGYMGFSGARWYCRSCLEIMYYLVRTKIQETIKTFENLGYPVIYGDTDSCFIKFNDFEKLKKDIEKINSELPSSMSLETEGFFKSGLFVMSRDKTKGAKKKYALLSEDGSLKIKGFEFVRRDWCLLVKEVQKEILLILLKSKDIKKAVEYVRVVIKDLENRNIPLNKLILQSFIHKKISNYKTINPAMYAYSLAKKENKNLKSKDLIEYIITNYPAKNISEKARIYDENLNLEYDINYYLENQLLPAIESIFDVFNISKDQLLTGKKQKGLNDFF